MARPRKYVVRLTDEEVERIQKKANRKSNYSEPATAGSKFRILAQYKFSSKSDRTRSNELNAKSQFAIGSKP